MIFYGEIWGGKRDKRFDFGSDQDDHADCPIGNPAITQLIMRRFWCNYQDSSEMMDETIV